MNNPQDYKSKWFQHHYTNDLLDSVGTIQESLSLVLRHYTANDIYEDLSSQ